MPCGVRLFLCVCVLYMCIICMSCVYVLWVCIMYTPGACVQYSGGVPVRLCRSGRGGARAAAREKRYAALLSLFFTYEGGERGGIRWAIFP